MTLTSEPTTLPRSSNTAIRLMTLHPVIASAGITTAVSLLFLLFPGIDTLISGTFYAPGRGFLATGEAPFRTLRSLGLLSINGSVIAVVGLTLVRCLIPAGKMPAALAGIRPRNLIFLVTTLALGPGLVANVILKDHWGRARPLDSILFGGHHAFTSAWIVSDACLRNCSFVSGEGSGIFWLVAFAFVVPERLRTVTAVYALLWAGLISLNRIAFGGHFLSDVLIGWGLMLIVILVLRDIVLLRLGDRIDAGVARWTGASAGTAR